MDKAQYKVWWALDTFLHTMLANTVNSSIRSFASASSTLFLGTISKGPIFRGWKTVELNLSYIYSNICIQIIILFGSEEIMLKRAWQSLSLFDSSY